MDPYARSPLDDCLLSAFAAVLARRGVAFAATRIGGIADPAIRATVAATWELTFRRDGRLRFVAWAAVVPGATPDLLDLLPSIALERPGPVPRPVTEPPVGWPDERRWTLLVHWGRLVHRHDTAMALLAALVPDAEEAERVRRELLAGRARCALTLPAQG